MRMRILAAAIATTSLAVISIPARTRIVSGRLGSTPEPVNSAASRGPSLVFPTEKDARHLLGTTPRHLEWAAVPMGSKMVLAFVVSPERSDRAPVILVTGRNQGASDWLRAIADQAAAAGFIAVVPDVLTGQGANGGDSDSFHTPDETARALAALGPREIARRIEAVRAFEVASPAANGISVRLDVDVQASTMMASVESGIPSRARAKFALTGAGLPPAIAFLQRETHDHPALVPSAGASANEHAQHFAMLAQAEKARPEIGQAGAPGANTSYAQKRPDLPADFYTAKATVENSKLKKEWVELQVGDVKMRTWVEYPAGTGKAGAVIVMQHGVGMDMWVRGVADQLAQSGFIAVAADVWAGIAPNGGGLDAFQYVDDALKASAKVTPEETMRRYKAARDYALKLPRSNGKTASLGFCAGGGNAFRFAGEVPELNGAVVFYGTPPEEPIMQKINAPVIGFYGENDARVTSTVEPATAAMKRLGKSYEPHVYPKTTHSFLLFQEVGGNPAAINDAWPRVIAFLKKNIM